MKTRAEPMQQVQLVLHGLITLLAVAACRSESSTGPEPPTAPTHLQGVLARPGETGVITLTTTAAATVPMSAPVVRTAVTNNLTGTLKLAGAAIINLAGTFNAGAIVVSGGGYTITATVSNGKMSGTYNGPNGIGTVEALPVDASGPTPQVLCGTSSGTDSFSGSPHPRTGLWDLVRSGSVLLGMAVTTNPLEPGELPYATLAGQVTGNDISLTAADPNGNTVGSASGTLSATSASGTYTSTDRLATGTWSASTASCSDPPVASVTVTPPTAAIAPGGSVQLTATTKDAAGNVLTGRLVTWVSSNVALASVSPTGLVTGVAAGGPVTITATSEGQSGTGAVTVLAPPGGPRFAAVWGSGPADVFAVASEATIWHYDGTSWGMQAIAPTFLNGVWGSAAVDVFTVGGSGTILHYDGTSWSAQASGTTQALYRMWGSARADMFAVGFGGTILHYDGSSWTPQASGTTELVTNVWGSQGSNVFAVGYSGTILHYDGTSWSAQVSGTTQILYGLWGSGGADIFAVGGSGTILHYDGTSWSAQVSGTTQALIGVWGSGATDVFAVGAGGTILHYNGTAWSQQLPRASAGPLTFTVVSAGGYHTCGVTSSDAAYCWGDNASGDLGSGTTPDSAIPSPVVAGELAFGTVSTGNHFTCGITINGAAYCWGDNSSGQLGNTTTTNSKTPSAVAGGLSFATISAGLSHTCAVTPQGAAYCWGLNDNGQLGNGTSTNSSVAVAVSGGIAFAAVSAGGSHTCGVDTSGQ